MSEISNYPSGQNLNIPWCLSEHTAKLKLEALQAEVQLSTPEFGVSKIKAGHESLPGKMLQVCFAPSIAESGPRAVSEAYIRQRDLVADYPPREQFPFRSWVYWRALSTAEHPAISALEAIVSTQTDLLDSHPKVTVTNSLPAIELWRLKSLEKAEMKQISLARSDSQHVHHTQGPGCYLWRLSGDRWSYAEMIPPSDFHSSEICRDEEGLVSVSHRLFERSLEKGVILKARVRGVLIERGRDAVNAMNWYRDLLNSELPLTV